MANYQTEAIVLGTENFGEANKMLTLFSRNYGLVKATAFGSRRPKNSLAASSEMFTYIEAELSAGSKVETLRRASILRRYKKLSEDLSTIAYGTLVAEVVRELLAEKQSEPEIFALLLDILTAFETHHPRLVALAALYQILERTGMQPNYTNCFRCGVELAEEAFFWPVDGGALCFDCAPEFPAAQKFSAAVRGFIVKLLALDWQHPPDFSAKRAELLGAEVLIINYLEQLIGKPLRSLEFLRQMG